MAETEKPTTTAESISTSQANVQTVSSKDVKKICRNDDNYCQPSYARFDHG